MAAAAISAFLDALEGTSDIEAHSLMMLRHGHVIAAGWWAPYGRERPHALYSLSKTFTVTAVALAADEGLLALDEPVIACGVWNGTRLLPAQWVAAATSWQIPTEGHALATRPDWGRGYGYQMWMSSHGYRFDGARGQFCIVLPEQDAVIAMTAGSRNMQAMLDAVWEHLLPGFADAPLAEAHDADSRLENRLRQLALPALVAQAAPADRAGGPARPSFPTVATASSNAHSWR